MFAAARNGVRRNHSSGLRLTMVVLGAIALCLFLAVGMGR